MVIHHHPKLQSNWSIWLWDTGQNIISKTIIWPLTCDLDHLDEHQNNGALPLMLIHHHAKNHSNWFSHLWDKLRADRQTSISQTMSMTLACDLDLLLEHLKNKKWSTHGYTLQYQNPFQLSHKSLKYRPKHGFQDFHVTCDLQPWPFWWTLTEQKIIHSW